PRPRAARYHSNSCSGNSLPSDNQPISELGSDLIAENFSRPQSSGFQRRLRKYSRQLFGSEGSSLTRRNVSCLLASLRYRLTISATVTPCSSCLSNSMESLAATSPSLTTAR